jgi:hypothetical protein
MMSMTSRPWESANAPSMLCFVRVFIAIVLGIADAELRHFAAVWLPASTVALQAASIE